jgi:hypothetical protein
MHHEQSNSNRSGRFQQAAFQADRAVVRRLKSAGLPSYIVWPAIAIWRLSAISSVIVASAACGIGVLILRGVAMGSREGDTPFRAEEENRRESMFYHPAEHSDAVDPRFDEKSQRW